jgi:uncharacterized protein (TIGR00269 family)
LQKCTKCDEKPSMFFRQYSGERLCRKCFTSSVEEKVKETISRYDMFRPTDNIAVAVSGGKDSVTLLNMLSHIEKDFPKTKLTAITIDEGIRGYRYEAVEIARENCEKLGVEHKVISFKDLYGCELDDIVEAARETGELTPCSYCGVLRRKALNIAAKSIGATKLATAHNLDDETQTILLNIIHGDAVRIARVEPIIEEGISGFVQRVKPFCEIPENEVALYAYVKKNRFQTTPCPYRYAAMRNDIRVMLNKLEVKYPGVKFTIFKSMERLRPAIKSAVGKIELKECKNCGEPTIGNMCKPCETLLKLKLLKKSGR